MRRFLYILLYLIILPSTAFSWGSFTLGNTSSGYVLKNSWETQDSNRYFNYSVVYPYVAGEFVPDFTGQIRRVAVLLKKNVSPVGDITMQIWSDNGGSPSTPNTSLSSSTTTINASTLTTSYLWYDFDFAGQAVTSGTHYWIIMTGDLETGGNYPYWGFDDAGGGANIDIYYYDTSWHQASTTAQACIRLYTYE